MNYIVYKTTNKINGKYYVGVHRTNPDIFDGYIGCGVSKKDKKKKVLKGFPKAVQKYGYENFIRETLFIFPDTEEGKQDAYKKESEIVTTEFIKDPRTYNISRGGFGPLYPHEREISQYTLDGVFIRTWFSIKEAEDALGLTSILQCCTLKSKYCGDWQWRYTSDNLDKLDPVRKREKTVYQFDLSGNLLKVWKSGAEASKQFDNPASAKSAIHQVCVGKHRHAFGYFFSYKNKFTYTEKIWGTAIGKYELDGTFICSYQDVNEAANAVGVMPNNIHRAIEGYQKTCKNYRWRFFYGNTSNIKPL